MSAGYNTAKDRSRSLRIGVVQPLDISPITLFDSEFKIEIDYSIARWQNLYGSNFRAASVIPSLVYSYNTEKYRLFAKLGIGLAYINTTRWGNRFIGDNWVFEDKLSLGTYLSENNLVAMTISHYSNAGTNKNNDGINIISLTYHFNW